MRSALILAGGSSSRLGIDKSLLEFGGKPLILQSAERLTHFADQLIIVVRDEQQYELLCRIVPEAHFVCDCISGYGPVAGLTAGLKCVSSDYVFVTGCDLPFLNVEVIARLFDLIEDYDAAVPIRAQSLIEPLHAVYYRDSTIKACIRALARGEKKVSAPLEYLRVRYLPVDSMRIIDPELLTFFNLNTKEDLKEAERLLIKYSASIPRKLQGP
jgi:molybdopterin-guanine dinucleotide biosynthesis protein A